MQSRMTHSRAQPKGWNMRKVLMGWRSAEDQRFFSHSAILPGPGRPPVRIVHKTDIASEPPG